MPENYAPYQERLVTLRKEIKKSGLDGFILPRTDEFQGEFLAPYAERLAWLTGFTGSAGACVILENRAVVMSDGRYTLQLKDHVDAELYDLCDSTNTTIGDWLVEYAGEGIKVGYDVWLYTPDQLNKIKDKIEGRGIELIPMDSNIIDKIWRDQPARPSNPTTIFPDDVAGKSSAQKRSEIAMQVRDQGCAACLITLGDSICWLLNIRGSDIDYSPLSLSYALLYADGTLDWFVDSDVELSGVNIFKLDHMRGRISGVEGKIWIDHSSAPIWFKQVATDIIDLKDPTIAPKSIKSMSEQAAVREAHINDGVALVKFLKWLDEQDHNGQVSEISAEEKLEGFRLENPSYIAPSFPTIAGYGEHGAIVHYRATKDSDKALRGDGLFLVDSGGQYRWGTTDITRVIAIGTPTQEMCKNYTRVLKGHIALASAVFSKGTIGKEIDVLARQYLQEVGLDYAHGTGHGVGCNLCVHEAAAGISPRGEVAFEAGMLISNEPGYYKEGEYGIRIESLVLVQNCDDAPDMLRFETVTLAPLEPKLIARNMLDDDELRWLKAYSKDIYDKLSPLLSDDERDWLKNIT